MRVKRERMEKRNTEEDSEESDQEKRGKTKGHTEQRGTTDARARVERWGEANTRGTTPGLDAGRAEQEEEDAGMEMEEVEGGREGKGGERMLTWRGRRRDQKRHLVGRNK